MRDFNHFGLLYLCKVGGKMLFYPTRVAVNLVLGSLNNEQPSDHSNISTNPSHSSTNPNDYHIGCTTVPAATVSATRALSMLTAGGGGWRLS